jgi:transcriptional regulator NrdR family protein
MLCPKCKSPDTISKRKFKPTEEIGRQKYSGQNLNRRRLVCLSCNFSFHTIEMLEEDYIKNISSTPIDSKARIR